MDQHEALKLECIVAAILATGTMHSPVSNPISAYRNVLLELRKRGGPLMPDIKPDTDRP
jgi:hypothetical protein